MEGGQVADNAGRGRTLASGRRPDKVVRLVIVAALLFALGTWFVPWPVVPVLAALLLLVAPASCTPGRLALAAALAWGGILGWTALHAPLGTLARALAGIVHLPAAAVIVLGPLVAAALAWAGAEVARVVQVRARVPQPATPAGEQPRG